MDSKTAEPPKTPASGRRNQKVHMRRILVGRRFCFSRAAGEDLNLPDSSTALSPACRLGRRTLHWIGGNRRLGLWTTIEV